MAREDCLQECPLYSLCKFREQEADWMTHEQDKQMLRRLAQVEEQTIGLDEPEHDRRVDEAIDAVLSDSRYESAGKAKQFRQLGEVLLDNCYAGPYRPQRLWLFGGQALRCASLSRDEVEARITATG